MRKRLTVTRWRRTNRVVYPSMAKIQRKESDDFLTPDDRELLERTFGIDDPSQLAGLLDRPPDTDEVPEIEYAYNVTPPGGRRKGHVPHLKCIFPHSARHWRGFVVRWSNGDCARLGPDCGADHFGFDFKDVEERFFAARSRKQHLKRFVVLRPLLPLVVAELRPLSCHPEVVGYDDLRLQFAAEFPNLHQALGVIAQADGLLRTTRQERDSDAEERRVEQSTEGRALLKACEDARNKSPGVLKACNHRLRKWIEAQRPIMKTVSHDAGVLSGLNFFTDPRPLQHNVAAAVSALTKVFDEITRNRSDHWTDDRPFSVTFRSLRDAIERIDAIATRIEDARNFSSQANLNRVRTWVELETQSPRPRVCQAIAVKGRILINRDTNVSWSFPAKAGLPALPKLEELRHLKAS